MMESFVQSLRYRWYATLVLAEKRLREVLVSPAFYVTLTVCFLLASSSVTGFVSMIRADGINPSESPVYGLLFNLLRSVFGELFMNRLFAHGPLIASLSVTFFIFIMYLGLSTVSQFGHEKGTGALEVVTSGPADETSCFFGYFIFNAAASLLFLVAITFLFVVGAFIGNIAMSASFFLDVLFLLLGALVMFGYCVLASVLTRSSFAALAAFGAIMLFFFSVQFGIYGTISEGGNRVAGTLAAIVQWVSPFFPINFGNEAVEYGSAAGLVPSVLVPVFVSFVLLAASHLVSRKKGVKV
jgi:hypothetical protein